MHFPRSHDSLELFRRGDACCAHMLDQVELNVIDRLEQPILLIGEQQRIVAHFAHRIGDGALPRGYAVPGDGRSQHETDTKAAGRQPLPGAGSQARSAQV